MLTISSQTGVISRYQEVLATGPSSALFINDAASEGNLSAFRDKFPDRFPLVRSVQTENEFLYIDPKQAAQNWFNGALPLYKKALPYTNRVLSHNEPILTNLTINGVPMDARTAATRANTFYTELSRLLHAEGFFVVGPNWSRDNPPLPKYEGYGILDLMVECHATFDAFSYHAYGHNRVEEPESTRRYRDIYDWFIMNQHPACVKPIYLTEGFYDAPGGYRGRLDPNVYFGQVKQFILDTARVPHIHWADAFVEQTYLFVWSGTANWYGFDVPQVYEEGSAFLQVMSDLRNVNQKAPLSPSQFAFANLPFFGSFPVTQGFGANPAYYSQFGLPGHEGIDYGLPNGTPVRAVAAGYVAQVGLNDSKYGNFVRVNHQDSWQTTYAHLQTANVQVGQNVNAGDVIALSDNTGNTTGPHLHLTLKRLGYSYTDANGVVWPFNIFDPTPFVSNLQETPPMEPTDLERLVAAFGSVAPYNPDAAFPPKARELKGGPPLGSEYRFDKDGVRYAGQGFENFFLDCVEGDWANIVARDWNTGAVWKPPQPPQPPTVKRLTTADLATGPTEGFDWRVISYVPQSGEEFYGLIGVQDIKVGQGTQFLVQVTDGSAPVFGAPATHAFDEVNHKWEQFLTDVAGLRSFVEGAGNDYTPGQKPPPDRYYIGLQDGADGKWPTFKGDVLQCGQVGGHTEGTFIYQKMKAT